MAVIPENVPPAKTTINIYRAERTSCFAVVKLYIVFLFLRIHRVTGHLI